MRNIFFLLCPALIFSAGLSAQDARKGAPTVFLDCQYGCDQQFLKTHLDYLNFVRDRNDADIFVQQTGISTGGGGSQLSLYFYGQRRFAGQNDTVLYNLGPQASESARREKMRQHLERGLLRYLLQTSVADRISFKVASPTTAVPNHDPWNFWTISINGNFSLNGQEILKTLGLQTGINARRVTQYDKTDLYANGNYNKTTLKYENNPEEIYESRGYSAGGSQIMAIDNHWSYGFWGNVYQSLYSNVQFNGSLKAGLEYNFFPYSEATKRQLSLQYRIGPLYNRYFEETIFFKTKELLWSHNLSLTYNQLVPWGSFTAGVFSGNYLHDWSLNETSATAGLEFYLFRGFRLSLNGNYSIVHNQITLPRQGATKEDALLSIRQLKSGYNFSTGCYITYTFGSIYSNVVNPRFN
jgi:hypothetical protein